MIKSGMFNNDDIEHGKRFQYFANSDGSRFYMQYFEYFSKNGWRSYSKPEEISEAEYRRALSVYIQTLIQN